MSLEKGHCRLKGTWNDWERCQWRDLIKSDLTDFSADTHTPGDLDTCNTCKSPRRHIPTLLRVIEPGSKGTDIGMQLTLATVWVVNILLSVARFFFLSFFFSSSREPHTPPRLSDWLIAAASGSLMMKSNVKLQRVVSRYACHNWWENQKVTSLQKKKGGLGWQWNSPHLLNA